MLPESQKQFLFFLGYLLGGIALLCKAVGQWREYKDTLAAPLIGRLVPPAALPPGKLGYASNDETMRAAATRTSGTITKVTGYNVTNIKQRVQLIADLARKDYLKPKIREAALAVLTRKCGADGDRQWCVPQKSWRDEVRALYEAVVDPNSPIAVRYTFDPIGIDLYTAPTKTMQLRGEDCDGQVAYLVALLMSVGYSPQLVVMATEKSPGGDFSHILMRVPKPSLSSDGSMFASDAAILLDVTMPEKGFGWEPPGLSDAIRSGKSSGIVTKVKVYKI